tara:strand:- start:48 stop:347 length:300 start_codon:yes stop_codon:yes gene_type:complete
LKTIQTIVRLISPFIGALKALKFQKLSTIQTATQEKHLACDREQRSKCHLSKKKASTHNILTKEYVLYTESADMQQQKAKEKTIEHSIHRCLSIKIMGF